MTKPSRTVYKSEQISNAAHVPSDEIRTFFAARNARHSEALEQAHQRMEQLQPTSEDRAIRTRVRDRLIEVAGRDDIAQLKSLKQARREALQTAALEATAVGQDLPLRMLPRHPVRDSAVGPEMWWAQTLFSWPSQFADMWWDADGLRFSGKFADTSGDLHQYWIKVIAQFEVDAARMPAVNRSYLSAPVASVSGWVSSITDFDLDFGDEWAKAFLNYRQTIFVMPPFQQGAGGISVAAAAGITASDWRPIVDGLGATWLPGLLPLPPVQFFVPHDATSISAELEIALHVQVEEGWVKFGQLLDAASCLVQTWQWRLQPW